MAWLPFLSTDIYYSTHAAEDDVAAQVLSDIHLLPATSDHMAFSVSTDAAKSKNEAEDVVPAHFRSDIHPSPVTQVTSHSVF